MLFQLALETLLLHAEQFGGLQICSLSGVEGNGQQRGKRNPIHARQPFYMLTLLMIRLLGYGSAPWD